MSIFESIFNKPQSPSFKKKEEGSKLTHIEKFNKSLEQKKDQEIEKLKEVYDSLLEHSASIGLTRSDMEEVLLSQIEKRGISPDVSNKEKGSGFEIRRKIAFLIEEKFGSTKLVEKIQEKFGLNYHLGYAIYPYVDLDSYPDIKSLSPEKLYLFFQSGLVKKEEKYRQDLLENAQEEATKKFILKNISPEIINSTKKELEKIALFIKEEEIKSDIIGRDNIFKEEARPENKAINIET